MAPDEAQGALFEVPPPDLKPWQTGAVEPRTLARVADPQTSHDAAAKLDAGRAGTIRRRLLAAISTTAGLTADEAAHRAGFDPADGSWKRVSDLINLGLIEPTGKTRPGLRSGRQQRVLAVTDDGRRALR